ncbi:MAG: DNA polymerase III subunit beta [Parcubacteria group bacterium]|nr:DNA polymerase III subunit beta [Parcubacteria group bacterium]
MKATCRTALIKDAVYASAKIAGRNKGNPILGSIRITAKNSGLEFFSTNLETGIIILVPATIESTGDIAIPAVPLEGFIGNTASTDSITLLGDHHNLEIHTPSSTTIIKGGPTADFPNFPSIQGGVSVSFLAREFISSLQAVCYAAAQSDIKAEIASVYLKVNGKHAVFVATDSFRLAEKTITLREAGHGEPALIIPYRSVGEIIRIFDGKDGDMSLSYGNGQLIVSVGNVHLFSRLIGGSFPEYTQIIPKRFATDVVLERHSFSSAVKVSAIFSNTLHELHLIAGAKNNTLTVTTRGGDTGTHTAHLTARVTGADTELVVNHRYIADALPHIHSSDIILRFPGERGPLVLFGIDDPSFQYLVMPMTP